MKDMITNGTGNSRYLKSNIPASTTLAQLITMLNNGTFPVDFNGLNNAGIAQQGDALNKANLLKDATAALYGLPNTAVPDDVLAAIRPLITTAQTTANGRTQIATGSYVGTGACSESSPISITLGFVPRVVFVQLRDHYNSMKCAIWVYQADCATYWNYRNPLYTESGLFQDASITESKLTNNSKTLNLVCNSINQSGKTYDYTAIG